MKAAAWVTAEIPFLVMLVLAGMSLWVEVGRNRLDLLPANLPLIALLIVYLVFRHHEGP